MNQFKGIEIKVPEFTEIQCDFKEHTEELILYVTLSGKCSYGSQGANYGTYLYQNIGLALLTTKPLAVLVDLQNLEYDYGDRILNLFQIFSDIKQSEDKLLTAFVMSDKNKYGLASLLQFNLENPESPFFYTTEKAYDYLFKAYDKL